MKALAQTIFYIVSPLVTLLAVLVAYLALLRQSRPHIVIHYRPNPNISSFIDLVVENLGNGMARNISFSKPLPVQCYGIDKPNGECTEALKNGLPALVAGQQYVFDGGQYGGLKERIGKGLEIEITYEYQNPIGINRIRKELSVLGVSHLENMPSRTSAEQAVVDALKGPNVTTLQRIEKELGNISAALSKAADENQSPEDA